MKKGRKTGLSRMIAGICAGFFGVGAANAVVADEQLTWFGETSFAGAYPNLEFSGQGNASLRWLSQEAEKASSNRFSIARFGAYQALSTIPLDGALRSSDLEPVGSETRIQSEFGFSVGRESFTFPVEISKRVDSESPIPNALGVKWRHQFGESSHLTLGARYSQNQFNGVDHHEPGNSASQLASVSWTSAWQGEGERAITGSLFFGDEKANNGSTIDASRQIYGLSVGGKWALSANHTPFVSYRYQTGVGDTGYSGSNLFEFDNATHLSAGWNWQVKPNWSIQAEADFAYQSPTLDLFNTNNTRLFFRTRYDFR